MNMKLNVGKTPETVRKRATDTVESEPQRPIQQSAQSDFPTKRQIERIDSKGAFLEIVADAFGFMPKDRDGIVKNHNGRVQINFVKLDEKNKQTGFEPFYLQFTEFLHLANISANGKLMEMAEAEKSKGGQYPKAIMEFVGGTPAYGGKPAKCRIFDILPAKKDNSFLLKLTVGEGVETDKGLIQLKSFKESRSIQIVVDADLLDGVLSLTKIEVSNYLAKI